MSLHVEPAAWVVLAAACAAYGAGVRRMSRRSERWPSWRSASFAAGIAALLVATTSPLLAGGGTPSSVAVAHVLILLVAPILLAGGAPNALATAAGGPGVARRVRAAMRSRAARLVTHPVVAWVLLGASLAALYGTSLHTVAARSEVVGQPVQLALLVAGCIFFWPVFGADPLPRRIGSGPATAYMLSLLPYFTLLGMAVESQGAATSVPGGGVAAAAAVGSDLQGAGGVLWLVGGLGSIILTIAVLVRWLVIEERSTPGRSAGLDPAAVAQLAAWREQRAAAAADEAARRAVRAGGAATPGQTVN